ncbi:anaerobic ribonucleoside-triphosphate reductase activating protein [Mobilisporobacter senegalensis]|uniref:Anaerobic ribonucleoside-triphosphate reductase-activating protein n=1 Tax=Mobilisporobacter senegalensis TaxID=1329262 RepID=A0A3N1X5P4_9FIRM|nr:anaerobic ribonucleoside-triphosphate reductase activating protein [Mobilisporobacter senegalensis]ROR22100.1 anaerobic ribonucleoside-triphosphate reductase activating protein [Mobilisporobacter senegalensis]
MRYHNITKDDMLNGDGLRVVLWVAGCTHACKECQNPVTWDINGGILFDEAAKEEIYRELRHSHNSGITFSGGDPLHPVHREEVGELIKELRSEFPKKSIWVYTGFTWDEIKDIHFMKDIDVLVDGKFVAELKDPKLYWRGSSNQNVIDVKKTIETGNMVLYL